VKRWSLDARSRRKSLRPSVLGLRKTHGPQGPRKEHERAGYTLLQRAPSEGTSLDSRSWRPSQATPKKNNEQARKDHRSIRWQQCDCSTFLMRRLWQLSSTWTILSIRVVTGSFRTFDADRVTWVVPGLIFFELQAVRARRKRDKVEDRPPYGRIPLYMETRNSTKLRLLF
jgi:hypothetical protein